MEDEQRKEKLQALKAKQAAKKQLQQPMQDQGARQVSTLDEDARLLGKRGKTVAGYNAQIAVDGRHKPIVAADLGQDGNDLHQLAPMLDKAQEILESERLTGLADSGYYEGNQLKICEENNITVYVVLPDQSAKASPSLAALPATSSTMTPNKTATCVRKDSA
ncbi:MAG: transposase [Methylococcales bacterium]